IVTALAELTPEKEPEWVIETSKILDHLNEGRSDKRRLTPQYLGKKLRAMGFRTKIVNGYSKLPLNRRDFNKLLDQFKVKFPPDPNSTKHLEF
ncbi:MAG: hypothetical protein Q7I94_02450, partial [Candidatus Contubernalis sp.]|nr:hypothetical protein [Candidatus Contubernalis sp.]